MMEHSNLFLGLALTWIVTQAVKLPFTQHSTTEKMRRVGQKEEEMLVAFREEFTFILHRHHLQLQPISSSEVHILATFEPK